MSKLTDREFWFISVYFKHSRGFSGSHDISDIIHMMLRIQCKDAESIVDSLIEKNVLSLSPDRRKVKFTDYGFELYLAMDRDQKDWEKQPIIKVSNIERDQILIRAGEKFRANRILREILNQVQKELCVIDAYLGPEIFDLIEDINPYMTARFITSDKAPKILKPAYKAFKEQ